jgi:hypothetical protein
LFRELAEEAGFVEVGFVLGFAFGLELLELVVVAAEDAVDALLI